MRKDAPCLKVTLPALKGDDVVHMATLVLPNFASFLFCDIDTGQLKWYIYMLR